MRLFIALFLISFSALATSWESLRPGQDYKITQSFELPIYRQNSMMSFMKGEVVYLKAIEPLALPGGFNMALYIFDYKNCPGPQMETELEIVEVENTSPVVKAGAQLESCELKVYIELKDYYSESFFK
ncbi:hypothetical protein ACJVC5_04700 [Peredibacter sp. HCB2-198]|uniref:hypothetical protein n=1 Tax=Peredibacter sp. HCB2-198 TaxID=3383025 RepID=UPI0038B6AB44